MKRLLIKNAHIVSAGIDYEHAALVVCGNRIDAILPEAPESFDGEVFDAQNHYLMPGFIDSHCHGRNNFDFCDGSEQGAACIAKNKLAEGVTTLLPTTLTVSENELVAALKSVAAYDQSSGCRIPGVHLEGPFINPKCLGAQNPDFVRPIDMREVERLNAIFPVKKITFAVEMPGGCAFVADLLKSGIVPSCTHSAATYQNFADAYRAGLRNLSHFCNQMTALHHRDIGLVGAGLLHQEVFAEFICDKLHISPPMIKLVFQVKGADHVLLISDAMRAAGMPDGDYTLGGLPVVVSGGAARLKEGGALAGSTLQIATALKNIYEITGLPISEAIKSATSTPAASLGLSDRGKLHPGYLADMVILDNDFKVLRTYVDGELRYQA